MMDSTRSIPYADLLTIEGIEMPLIYRGMIRDGDHPAIGNSKKMLGVEVPGDVAEQDGEVRPGRGGMSVAPTWKALPMHRVPRRLKHLSPKATGSNRYECWKMGDGPFVSGPIAEGLNLRPDKPYHAVIEPASPMATQAYRDHLAATRDLWEIEEETKS
jgi:hypothetical protein